MASGYIVFLRELTRFPDGLDVDYEGERKVKKKIQGLWSGLIDGNFIIPLIELEKTGRGGAGLR